jgi:hypothetical protein
MQLGNLGRVDGKEFVSVTDEDPAEWVNKIGQLA